MKKKILALAIFLGLIPGIVFADGMVIPSPYKYVTESAQKAAIFHENGKEDLVLSVSYEGDADKFSWIVPTPSKPEINKASEDTFEKLNKYAIPKETFLTKFVNWFLNPGPGYSGGGVLPMPAGSLDFKGDVQSEKPAVEVVSEKQVGAFDTATLKADDSLALEKWLKDNEYQVEIAKNKVIDGYIKKGWYFVAMKVAPDYQTAKITSDLKSGTIAPIIFSFKTDKMIYPLEISSLNSRGGDQKLLNYLANQFFNDLSLDVYSESYMKRSKIAVFSEVKFGELKKQYNDGYSIKTDEVTRIKNQIRDLLATVSERELSTAKINLNYVPQYAGGKIQGVTIYTFADKKLDADNYQGVVAYAEKLSKSKTNSFFSGSLTKSRGYFFTKLNLSKISTEDMTKDLHFKDAINQEEIGSGKMNVGEWMLTILAVPLLLLYAPITLGVRFPFIIPLTILLMLIGFIAVTAMQFADPERKKYLVTLIQSYIMFPVLVLAEVLFVESIYNSVYYASSFISSPYMLIILGILAIVFSFGLSLLCRKIARKIKEKKDLGNNNVV